MGGRVRRTASDCGSSADHENPVTGVTNYLYATRNVTLEATIAGSPSCSVSVAYREALTAWLEGRDAELLASHAPHAPKDRKRCRVNLDGV